ncbi:hypothetical protein D3C73_835440 [compost metagenome]
MISFQYDRLCGSQTLQTTHSGISAKITLPSNIIVGSSPINGVKNDDYVNFYMIYNEEIEGGISWTPYAEDGKSGFRIFLNTGAFEGGDALYWRSKNISDLGLSFGFGSTVTLTLVPTQSGKHSQLWVNGKMIWDLPNYRTQPITARVAYTHGCKDQYGYVQHNTATWSQTELLRNGVWVSWVGTDWGYGTYRKNDGAYGIYQPHPMSAYLSKPNGPDPAGDGIGV